MKRTLWDEDERRERFATAVLTVIVVGAIVTSVVAWWIR